MACGSDCRLKASNVALPITVGVTPFGGSALAIVATPRESVPTTTVFEAIPDIFMVILPFAPRNPCLFLSEVSCVRPLLQNESTGSGPIVPEGSGLATPTPASCCAKDSSRLGAVWNIRMRHVIARCRLYLCCGEGLASGQRRVAAFGMRHARALRHAWVGGGLLVSSQTAGFHTSVCSARVSASSTSTPR